jgi:hypothetical protein
MTTWRGNERITMNNVWNSLYKVKKFSLAKASAMSRFDVLV